MVKTASLLSQLLQAVPRHEFAKLVREHQAEYRATGFTCWTQLVSIEGRENMSATIQL